MLRSWKDASTTKVGREPYDENDNHVHLLEGTSKIISSPPLIWLFPVRNRTNLLPRGASMSSRSNDHHVPRQPSHWFTCKPDCCSTFSSHHIFQRPVTERCPALHYITRVVIIKGSTTIKRVGIYIKRTLWFIMSMAFSVDSWKC